MEINNKKKILILAPHTDDAEFGMGGTIAKLISNGNEVFCAAFSACKQSLKPELPEDILVTEVKNASATLGIKPENLFLYEYDVRTFGKYRQEILEQLILLRKQLNPDVIFIPSLNDVHQDHKVISEEGVRAFKQLTLLCYELPWNNLTFTNTCYSVLSEEQVNLKVKAIAEYRSQAHRDYTSADYIRSLARTRGVQIGKEFAECFEIVRFTF
jgi:N-acetylglucosamine malate deacetylase 1